MIISRIVRDAAVVESSTFDCEYFWCPKVWKTEKAWLPGSFDNNDTNPDPKQTLDV